MSGPGRVWVGLVLAAMLAACDGSNAPVASGGSPVVTRVTSGPDPTPPATGPTTAEGCIDGTVVQVSGAQGVISAGPLGLNRQYWRQEPQGTKFWVASTRDQPPGPAYIEARRLDGAAEPVVVERPVLLATPVPSVVPFYPGALRIPQQGRWKITVRIGPDSACFVVLVD